MLNKRDYHRLRYIWETSSALLSPRCSKTNSREYPGVPSLLLRCERTLVHVLSTTYSKHHGLLACMTDDMSTDKPMFTRTWHSKPPHHKRDRDIVSCTSTPPLATLRSAPPTTSPSGLPCILRRLQTSIILPRASIKQRNLTHKAFAHHSKNGALNIDDTTTDPCATFAYHLRRTPRAHT